MAFQALKNGLHEDLLQRFGSLNPLSTFVFHVNGKKPT